MTRLALGAAGIAAILTAAAAPAGGAETPAPHGAALQALYDCRALTEVAASDACFRRAAAAIEKAEQDHRLVILDRDAVRANRTRDFGAKKTVVEKALQEPKAEKPLGELSLRLDHVQRLGDGRLVFYGEDGAVWRQKDARDVPSDPKKGAVLEIRRGTFGTYYCTPPHAFAVECERLP